MKYTPRLPLPTHILTCEFPDFYSSCSDCDDWLDDDGLYTCEFCGHRYDGNAQCFCIGICDESPPPPPPGTPTKKRPLSKDRFEEEQGALTIQKFWRMFNARSAYVRHLEQSVRASVWMNESTFDGTCPEKFKWIIGHTYDVGDIIKYCSGNRLMIGRVTKVNKKSIRKETGEIGWYGDFTSWSSMSKKHVGKFCRHYAADHGKQYVTLEEAQSACLADPTANGVTQKGGNGTYTVRRGASLHPSPSSETSWIKRGCTSQNNLQIDKIKIWKLKPVEEPPQRFDFCYDDSFQELLICDDEENNYGRGYS